MPARDKFHDAVRKALEKDGWTITHDPLPIKMGGADMSVDLGAERIMAAVKGQDLIAVEIKSFTALSLIYEFYNALGQFLSYKVGLEKQDPDRVLYLAVPTEAYDNFFRQPFAQIMIERYELRLIVYEPRKEVLLKWIS
ncbi:MAG: XisH family protein [Acidobacteriota bacterium]